jgi:hypothetical protein
VNKKQKLEFLKNCCMPKGEIHSRYYLDHPFRQDGYWYATDGRIMARFQCVEERKIVSIGEQPNTSIVMGNFPRNWSKSKSLPDARLDLGILNTSIHPNVSGNLCSHCGGTGVIIKSVMVGTVPIAFQYFEIIRNLDAIDNVHWLPRRTAESIWFRSSSGIEGCVMGLI